LHIGVEVIVFYYDMKCNSLLHAGESTSLLHIGVEVIVFYYDIKCNSLLHAGVEAGDEAHPGPQDLSDHRAAPSGARRLVGEGSGDLGLALRLLGIRPV
jgi:hypothetical protein